MSATVTIHGAQWKLDDIRDEIEWCRERSWEKQRWRPTPALVHKKGGTVSEYRGQKYDPDKILYVEDGWTHDHCVICWFGLHDTEKEEEGTGWTDGYGAWLCQECYEQFISERK